MKRGIDKAVEAGVAKFFVTARKYPTVKKFAKSQLYLQIGTPKLVKLSAEAMDKVGKDGTITVEEAKSIETTLDVVEGMQFDKGYLSPYFCTNNDTMESILEDCYILINEKKITALNDLLPVLQLVSKQGKATSYHR